jgi:quercetin dioxygenase-like cupin family protein
MSMSKKTVFQPSLSGTKEGRVNNNPFAYALGSEEGEPFWFFGGLVTVKASAEQSGAGFALTEQSFPKGMATPLHRQPEDDESFYVLEGELTFYLEDGRPMPAAAGSFLHVPAGVAHAFQVDSETARILNITTAQHERFFRATSDPAQARTLPPEAPPDMERIMAAAREHGVEILGPPPGAHA